MAHDTAAYTDEQIHARLSQMNYEFLARSNIAILEFVHALIANIEWLEENISVLDKKGLEKFSHKMEDYIKIHFEC